MININPEDQITSFNRAKIIYRKKNMMTGSWGVGELGSWGVGELGSWGVGE
ncbi:hypothetical protein LS482_13250 [Sinomicrobium kalidii]|uniref:hypothetical protein n=1 Tax=Sinomicrobium kalidii TaxID=2900738 RepID=UPI001E41E602|nr:hypothetical protein [Sinomicrobium kalidii]UGU14662.1 hypothetical protein LS482_13250 [Sinomicrobium kalidii]